MKSVEFLEKQRIELREWHKKTVSAFLAGTKFTASGFATTPPEILAAREAICRACDQWDAAALNATGRCRKCGCSTWAKIRMATEACPLGKWLAISSPSVSPVSSAVNPLPPAPEATRKPE